MNNPASAQNNLHHTSEGFRSEQDYLEQYMFDKGTDLASEAEDRYYAEQEATDAY